MDGSRATSVVRLGGTSASGSVVAGLERSGTVLTNGNRTQGAGGWVAVALLACALVGSACGSELPAASGSTGGGSSSASAGGAGSETTVEDDTCDNPPTGFIMPFAEGNSWTYAVTDKEESTTTTKTTEVQGLAAVGVGDNADLQVNKVLTKKKDGTDKTESWQGVVGDALVRYREDAFQSGATLDETQFWKPHKLHADGSAEHTAAGKNWTDGYYETKIPVDGQKSENVWNADAWSVVSSCELIAVPAGKGPNGSVIPARKRAGIRFKKYSGSGNEKQYVYVRGVGKVLEDSDSQTEKLTGFTLSE